MKSFLSTRSFLSVGVLVALALVLPLALSACGDNGNKEKAKKSAVLLSDYYYQVWKPPSGDWEIRKVKPGKESDISIETQITTKQLSRAIMERSKMEQMEIARMACPTYTDKVWKEIDKEQSVGVVLSGSAGHIINALCKRP